MFFPKPFIFRKLHTETQLRLFGILLHKLFYWRHQELGRIILVFQRFQGCAYGMLGTSETDPARQHHGEFNFSEVFVHQMIYSIEFVLGALSSTQHTFNYGLI